MKKLGLLLGLMGTISFSFAQSVKFGVKAGVNFSSETLTYAGSSATSDTYTGFHIGGIADIPFNGLSLQPGILFSVKGAPDGTLSYIEIPVNLLYNIPVAKDKIFLGGGPYFGYGISGSNGITFGSGTGNVANPDYGINILAGYHISTGLCFSAGYGFGLANLTNNISGVTDANRVASISIGYFFK